MASVTSWSSEEKYCSATRRMSSSWGSELTGAQCAKPQPWAKITRERVSWSAAIAASECSGVLRLCDQSSSVVMPPSSASSVPIRLPA